MASSEDSDIPKGLIFNIQRFSVHDGPGIRTTVFMKGCPLTCLWCSNPESQALGPQLMTRDIKCTGCGAYASLCPRGAIKMNSGGREIDWDKCEQCLLCVDACMYGALHRCGEEMTVEEILDEVLSDKLFYKNSGGGVTVSGGEPLLQSGFVAALLEACNKEGLSNSPGRSARRRSRCSPTMRAENRKTNRSGDPTPFSAPRHRRTKESIASRK